MASDRHAPDHPARGLSGASLDAALLAAERHCAAMHEDLKAASRKVLEQLLIAGEPVKAYDLMTLIAPGGRPASPPIVYRALKFLLRVGLAHKIETLNAFVACRLGPDAHMAGFLVCERCGAAEEHPLGRTPDFIAAHSKAVTQVVVEANWLCDSCAAGVR